MSMPTLSRELAAIVGERNCSDDPEILQSYLDEPRGRFRGRSRLLVAPADAGQTADVLARCNRRGAGVVPVGGRTGLCGGTHTKAGEVLLSLHRQCRVRRIASDSLTAEAGCVLAELQEHASEAGCLFPLSLGSEGSCQLGGVLSTNAGGIHVLRYGMARSLVLGLEVALPDGRLLADLNPLVKDNTGYDVKQLFIGSEGTLGVITAATLRLYPRPTARVTALLGVESAARAVALYHAARSELGAEINAVEIVSRAAARLCEEQLEDVRAPGELDAPWLLCVELAGPGEEEALVERLAVFLDGVRARGETLGAVCAASESQRDADLAAASWRLRSGPPLGSGAAS